MVGNEDNIVYSIPLEDLYEFVTTELPYVFIKEE